MKKLRVAVVQVAAGLDSVRNMRRLEKVVSGVRSADIIALPEVFSVRGGTVDYLAAAEPLDGPLIRGLCGLARRKAAWILAGSIIERARGRTYNTCVLIDRRGRIAATYRKMHLFDARLDDGTHVRETDVYSAGRTPVMTDIEGWPVGLAICYDLRFPELFRRYAASGAALMFVPSNFTQRTGRDHWKVLVRARAIENQCFVVAPNQCGRNEASGVSSYGHSMVVGPWGEVLCEARRSESVLTTELDPGLLGATRSRIPVLKHRVMGLKRP
ncbi:MAG: carbon-nitrogen hydrolase family protein [bacterium]